MKKTLNVYEWKPAGGYRNYGDALTGFILRKLGYDVVEPDATRPVLFGCGSILAADHRPPCSRIVVWGSGAGAPWEPGVGREWLAVRGPVTRDLFGLPAGILTGDPALLLPHVVGRLPHVSTGRWLYVDHVSAPGAATRVGTDDDDVLRLTARIAGAKHVYTESLHGAVVASAYGVPYTYMSKQGLRPGLKWRDWESWRLSGAVFDPDRMISELSRSLTRNDRS